MGNFSQYIEKIRSAVYGEEVRGSIIGALEKVNDDNENYINIKNRIEECNSNVENINNDFDTKVQNAQGAINTLTQTTTNANDTNREITQAIQQAQEQNQALTQVNNQAENNTQTLTQLNSQTQNNTQTLLQLNSTTTGLHQNLQGLCEQAQTITQQVQASTQTGQQTISDLTQLNTQANQTLTQLSSQNTQAQEAVNRLDEKTTLAQTQTQTTEEAITHLKNVIEQMKIENEKSTQTLEGINELKAHLGIMSRDVLGVTVDFENNTVTPIAGSVGLTHGADYNHFPMFGDRRRCIVNTNGQIKAYWGDRDYNEDGTLGDVMVYQPKFYYKVTPVKTSGNTLLKANYYISQNPHVGFKLHPAFYDSNNKPLDYILIGAYEAVGYNLSRREYTSTNNDFFEAPMTLRSLPNHAPVQIMFPTDLNAYINGKNWRLLDAQTASAEQLLMLIEYATFDTQKAIGIGNPYSGTINTGSTVSLGNKTGTGTQEIEITMISTEENQPAEDSRGESARMQYGVSYRGVENFWGNTQTYITGIKTDRNNQLLVDNTPTRIIAPYTDGYITRLAYTYAFDWLFMPAQTQEKQSTLIPDYYSKPQGETGSITLGGATPDVRACEGAYNWDFSNPQDTFMQGAGARLIYKPTSK